MMHLIVYATKNLLRNKRRTALTLFSIAIAVAILLLGNANLNGILGNLVGQSIRDNGHIIIQTKGYTKNERTLPLNESVPDMNTVIEAIEKHGAVYAAPRFTFGAVLIKGERSSKSLGHAFDAVREKDFVKLSDAVVNGSYFTGSGKEIMIGVELARSLVVTPGETLTLLTRDRFGGFKGSRFTVRGIIDLGAYQLNRMFYIPVDKAWKLLDSRNAPQRLAVILPDFSRAPEVKRALLRDSAIKTRGLDVFRADEVGLFQTMFVYILFIIRMIFALFLAVSVVVIANTMMMSGLERTAEIGVLAAMGMKARAIAASFLFEALALGVFGSLIGSSVGAPIALYLSKHGYVLGSIARGMPIPMKTVIYPELSLATALTIAALGVFISIIAGMIPAVRALKLNPAFAIRDGSK